MSDRRHIELTPEEERDNTKAVLSHVLPFAIWLTMMVWFDDPTWSYMMRSIGGLITLAVFRPWRWYPRLQLKNIPAAIGVGIFILIVWVGFETPWMVQNAPGVTEWYDRFFVDLMKPFQTREMFEIAPGVMAPYEVIQEGEHAGLHAYDPRASGWLIFAVHMLGTSVFIAVIEEFFYRGYIQKLLTMEYGTAWGTLLALLLRRRVGGDAVQNHCTGTRRGQGLFDV